MARIYISSTYQDLKDYREVVYHTLRQLRHDVIAMEDYVATDARPVDKCLQDVASCDVYVGILAFRYGYVPEENNPKHLSITELEYRRAGESGVARLVFLVKDDAVWSVAHMDAMADEQGGRRIAALRNEVKKAHVDSFFESAEELARQVSVAVQRALESRPAERAQIDWDAPRRRLIDHMRRFAGAPSEYEAMRRYLPLTVQATRAVSDGSTELPVGKWTDLVTYPGKVLLIGEPGSGKTTLLLHEVQRLAAEARENPEVPLPIYLSLRSFAGGDGNTLLEMAANDNRIDIAALRALWTNSRRPVCLFLDGGDETIYREQLIDAIVELGGVFTRAPGASDGAPPEVRSLVVACHPGPLQERMTASNESWREFLLMPLSDADIDAMLTRFEAASLVPSLDDRLRRAIRRPDLLSALAQSARDRPAELLPRNAAEIYDLYLAHAFKMLGSQYDYERVQKPVIAHIAYDMARTRQSGIACDDALYESIASDLETLHHRFHRRRRVMPHDWSAEELHDELLRSPVMDLAAGRGEILMFSKATYRDYFVAVHLKLLGVTSGAARELIGGLSDPDQLEPLSFLLRMTSDAAMLFDVLSDAVLAAGAQVWLEDRIPGVPVPARIGDAYRDRCARIRAHEIAFDEAAQGAAPAVRKTNRSPRKRANTISELARQCPLPAIPLLEAAGDDHPVVRAVAQYALLQFGLPSAGLDVRSSGGNFRWRSYGAGMARIGPLRLLDVPVPMALDLNVRIAQLDHDPWTADAEFAFLATSPALFAADLFANRTVDWLELLALLHEIAIESDHLARLAGSRSGLGTFTTELRRRAAAYFSVGSLLAADMGIPWENSRFPGELEVPASVAAMTYQDLRRMFSRTNQSHSLRLSHLSRDPVFSIEHRVAKVTAGQRKSGLHIGGIEPAADVDTHGLVVINNSLRVEAVESGSLRSIDIARVHGFRRELPLDIHINDRLDVRDVTDGDVGGTLIASLDSVTCPLRVNESIRIDRFSASRLSGVRVTVAEPRLETA